MHAVDKAFLEVNRADFLPDRFKHMAAIDAPLPIGYGQTNSQPSTVRQMLLWLGAEPGNKVLDIGSGSGWTTALLAALVQPGGKVYAVEKIKQLLDAGKANCKKAGVFGAEFFPAGNEYGLAGYAPYDRILVSASARELPEGLISQLVVGGKLVIPVGGTIWEITRTHESGYSQVAHPGFKFVPLV